MTKTIRAFVALTLPAETIDFAAGLQSALKAKGWKLRWVRPQNMHLTLKFLGDIPEADTIDIGLAVQRASECTPPLALTVQGLGVFPGIKRPRVLWIGLGGQVDALRQLYCRIEDELAGLGFAREKRGLTAHLTLARFKEGMAPQNLLAAFEGLGNYAPRPFTAKRLVFYKSDLKPQGAIYTPLTEVLLEQDRR